METLFNRNYCINGPKKTIDTIKWLLELEKRYFAGQKGAKENKQLQQVQLKFLGDNFEKVWQKKKCKSGKSND